MSIKTLIYNVIKKLTIDSRQEHILSYIPNKCVIMEIGVWKGELTKLIIQRKKPYYYYLIDPYNFATDLAPTQRDTVKDQDEMNWICNNVQMLLTDTKQNHEFHRDLSEDAKLKHKLELDILYIDGSHDYDKVIADLKKFSPLVKEYGLIICDDYKTRHEGVARAVNEFLTKNKNFTLINEQYNQAVLRRGK